MHSACPARRKTGPNPTSAMKVYQFLVLYVVGSTAFPAWYHQHTHGSWNSSQVALTFFMALNFLICLWEIALWRYIDHIADTYKSLQSRYGTGRMKAVIDLFLSPADVLSLKFWSQIWAVYALYDPSYADQRSYGFFIDIGNGHSMLIPSAVWICGMTFNVLSAKALGILGLIAFYQMLYGTILYFTSFFTNGRHVGKSSLEIALFVGLSNGLWFFFPLWGMWASTRMIYEDSFAVFGRA